MPYNDKRASIDWDWLNSQPIEKHDFTYIRHIRLSMPLKIVMNGKIGEAIVALCGALVARRVHSARRSVRAALGPARA